MNITTLFDMAYMGHMRWNGIRNLQRYSTTPKLSANARVMRHFMKHQRQMQNAKRSGIGKRETARRRKHNENNHEVGRPDMLPLPPQDLGGYW